MRKLRYSVAMSLDGYIAGPEGKLDWITIDPESNSDLGDFMREVDTLLMGRATYLISKQGPGAVMPGKQTVVCSQTLNPQEEQDVIVLSDAVSGVKRLKSTQGKDIWLFGGAELFRVLLDAGLVDTIEVAVMPVMLSGGVPLLPQGDRSPKLQLLESRSSPNGSLSLKYRFESKS